MSPRPNMEKCPELWVDGKTSFPGSESLGAFLAICPPRWSFLAMAPTGLSAGLVATLTITLALNTYCEKNTQKTSYKSNPDKSSVDTLRLGNLTNAMNATHRPIPMASISSQWPVIIQMNTTNIDMEKLSNSAEVNLPQKPNDILLLRPQGLEEMLDTKVNINVMYFSGMEIENTTFGGENTTLCYINFKCLLNNMFLNFCYFGLNL